MLTDYEDDLKKCVESLKRNGVILYPTDTIWGLGCDATQTKAVKKIFDIKRREESKTFIVLLSDVAQLAYYLSDIPPIAYDLIEQVDTPLTIIYPNARNLAQHVISSENTVAIRVVRDDFCRDLINLFGGPIVSTSANYSGEPNPMLFADINPGIIEEVDYTVFYKRNAVSNIRPSTIIRLTGDWEYVVVRN